MTHKIQRMLCKDGVSVRKPGWLQRTPEELLWLRHTRIPTGFWYLRRTGVPLCLTPVSQRKRFSQPRTTTFWQRRAMHRTVLAMVGMSPCCPRGRGSCSAHFTEEAAFQQRLPETRAALPLCFQKHLTAVQDRNSQPAKPKHHGISRGYSKHLSSSLMANKGKEKASPVPGAATSHKSLQ